MKKNYFKTVVFGLVLLTATTLKGQEFENYAVLYNDDIENLLDTVFYFPETSPTVGNLRCGAMENGKKKKGVNGKVIPTDHIKKAYFHNRTYIAMPYKNMKGSHLCNVLAFSDDDILVAADYGNALNVWVIDRHTFEFKTRAFALRNRGKSKDVDYNLQYFKKAVDGSFKDYPELIKELIDNLKKSKHLYYGKDYYKCGNSTDLYESLKDKYEELSKNKSAQRKESYERAF